jgi:glycosyltransferase involved in cell wall biosynthesis
LAALEFFHWRISRQLHVMYRVILPISAVGLGFLGLVERPAIQLLFSSQFKSSAEFLPLLLVGNSLQAASWVTGAPLLGCARVRAWLTLQMIGACLRYLAVLAFLPTLGPQAIPLAFLLGQMFDMIASLVLSSRILKIVTSRADLARIGLSSVLPGVLALLGLHPTPATFSAGVVILIAGGIILAPAQASRLAVKATEITTRWRPHSKHQTIMKDGLNTMSEQLSDAQASKIPPEYLMGSSAVMSSERGPAVRASNNIPPLVSVIIPAYNNVGYLEDAVDSVFGQTYPAMECIVIDDGSTDHTAQIIEKVSKKYPSLKTARKVNGGPSSARNMGLRMCSGDFVSFLDHDDVLLPDKISRQVDFLNAHPDVGLVHSDYLVVSKELHPLAVFAAEMPRGMDPLDALCYRNWFNPLVALVRRSLIDKIGDFDAELDGAEDWDYWIRCAKATRISYLAGPVALYRQHGGQMSRNYYRMKSACLLVAKKNFNENGRRLRLAMAAIELTYARHLWIQRQRPASLAALLKSGLQHGFGLHMGNMLRQFQIMTQSQLKPL